MKQRNTTIDFGKYIASLLVVAIHTALFKDINEEIYFVFVHIICRVAVPFFAICTGYFLGQKLDLVRASKKNKVVFFKQWKKIVVLYLVWTIFYLVYSVPSWVDTGWFSYYAFIDYSIAAISVGSHYHLWYLLSLIYALPFLYLVIRFVKEEKYYRYLGLILWMIKVASYSYAKWMPVPIASFFTCLGQVSALRDAVFCILPLLLLGVWISNNKKAQSIRWYMSRFLLSFVLLCVEAFKLRNAGQTTVSYIAFTFPTMYFLFNLLLYIRIPIKEIISARLSSICTSNAGRNYWKVATK